MALHAEPVNKFERHGERMFVSTLDFVTSQHPDCEHTELLGAAITAEQPRFVKGGLDQARDLQREYTSLHLAGMRACEASVRIM